MNYYLRIQYVLTISLATLICSCQKNDSDPDFSFLTDTTISDVSYGNDAQQKMDLYLPANRSHNTRTIVMIHGGGWNSGDKSQFTPYLTALKSRLPDHAFANLNYRLSSGDKNRFPAQESDVKQAVEFLRDHSGSYGFSNEIFLVGLSAGAQLALLQGYKHPDILKVKGIVSFFGPADMTELYKSAEMVSLPWILKTITGFTLEENPSLYKEASAINYITGQSPPTLIFHGDKDTVVPVQQAAALRAKLNSVSVPNQLVIYPGEGHGWTGDKLTDSFNKIEAFLKNI